MDHPAPLSRLIDELRHLPGIGPKSAQRLAFHLLKASREDNARLAAAIQELRDSLRTCSRCNAVTDRTIDVLRTEATLGHLPSGFDWPAGKPAVP